MAGTAQTAQMARMAVLATLAALANLAAPRLGLSPCTTRSLATTNALFFEGHSAG